MSRLRPEVPARMWKQILERAQHRCQNPACNTQATNGNRLVPDHILSVVRGGTTDLDNLQVLCEKCNRAKGCEGNEALPDEEAVANRGRPGQPKASIKPLGIVVPMRLQLAKAPDAPAPEQVRAAFYEERAAAVSEDGYTPTEKQDRFRRTAQRCLLDPKAPKPSPPEWILVHEDEHSEIVRLDEFETWMKEEAFERWFYAPLLWTQDAAHQRMMKGYTIAQINRGVMAGDVRMIEASMSLHGLNKRPTADQPASLAEDLKEFKKKGTNGKQERSASAKGLAMGDDG